MDAGGMDQQAAEQSLPQPSATGETSGGQDGSQALAGILNNILDAIKEQKEELKKLTGVGTLGP
jgi:hypothetical protein